jgi:hypothetical protein
MISEKIMQYPVSSEGSCRQLKRRPRREGEKKT